MAERKEAAEVPDPELSLVIPAYNEEECIQGTVREAREVLLGMGRSFEILVVDDGSTDGTHRLAGELKGEMEELRLLRLEPNSGQSAAMLTGIKRARGEITLLMDADGQNDPAAIPDLVAGLEGADMCCGYRAERKDTFARRIGSRIANAVRDWLLGDGIIDTGCTLKAFRTGLMREFDIWRGMHRFLPALAQMRGAAIKQIPVNHRPRTAGTSKYNNMGRLGKTIPDVLAVRWMQRRRRNFAVEEEA